jgi:superfamily II DNA or RNA helicase
MESKMVKIAIGNLHSKINADKKIIDGLRKLCRYENDFMTRRQSQFKIPQYYYLMNDEGTFFTGLLDGVVNWLNHNKVEFELEDNRSIQDPPDEETVLVKLRAMKLLNPPIKLRDYQFDAVVGSLQQTRGLIEVATGGGKSIIMSTSIYLWGRKTLVLVDSTDLARQLREDLELINQEPVGIIGDGEFDEQRVTIAMVQTLSNKKAAKKRKVQIDKFLKSVEHVVLDECHHAQAGTWRKVLRDCNNAGIVHGYTATPFTSKIVGESGEEANLDILLRAYIGPNICRIKTKQFIDQGWLSAARIHFVKHRLYFDGSPLPYTEEYERIIVKDEKRNRKACSIISDAYREGKQVIGFVTRIEHGEVVADMLTSEFGVPADAIGFVTGQSNVQDRKGMLKNFKEGGLPILLGTVLSEGLNFFCEVGINLSAGDSKKNTIQRLGRVLRKKKTATGDVDRNEQSFVDYYDFTDDGHPYFYKHGRNRSEVYKDEGHPVDFIEVQIEEEEE